MFSVEFQTGALLLLAIAGLSISLILWRDRNDRKLVEVQTLEGVGHELRLILLRFMAELSAITHDEPVAGGELMVVRHPQLDAVYSLGVPGNRNALSIIGATYQTLQSRKNDLIHAAQAGEDLSAVTPAAIDAVIDAITTLYLWEEHGGAKPANAPMTRTWRVRQWMIGHGMVWNVFPDMHLRDEVVERLRTYGMRLTPRPLTHTAHEYYSMRYDRKADRNAPMWKRSKKNSKSTSKKAAPVKLAETLPHPVGDGEQVVVG
ncbi:MAG: hypothetical protein MRY64_04725 [Hyphomonadaceae bacterium]|nr:hypothetical protein [Hyphomonadaceae bacterium]